MNLPHGYIQNADGSYSHPSRLPKAHENNRQISSSKPEPSFCDEPMAAEKGEAKNSGRFSVRVISFRRRLCDPDNLCPKYFIDCLRYAGLLPDDRPDVIELAVSQEKVKTREEERTEIEIFSREDYLHFVESVLNPPGL